MHDESKMVRVRNRRRIGCVRDVNGTGAGCAVAAGPSFAIALSGRDGALVWKAEESEAARLQRARPSLFAVGTATGATAQAPSVGATANEQLRAVGAAGLCEVGLITLGSTEGE